MRRFLQFLLISGALLVPSAGWADRRDRDPRNARWERDGDWDDNGRRSREIYRRSGWGFGRDDDSDKELRKARKEREKARRKAERELEKDRREAYREYEKDRREAEREWGKDRREAARARRF